MDAFHPQSSKLRSPPFPVGGEERGVAGMPVGRSKGQDHSLSIGWLFPKALTPPALQQGRLRVCELYVCVCNLCTNRPVQTYRQFGGLKSCSVQRQTLVRRLLSDKDVHRQWVEHTVEGTKRDKRGERAGSVSPR